MDEFPVASIGSKTITFLFFILGSLNKYSTGSYVCSSLYKPIWPFSASGKNLIKPSNRPRPALNMGTRITCCAKSLPLVFIKGVCTETFLYCKCFRTSAAIK